MKTRNISLLLLVLVLTVGFAFGAAPYRGSTVGTTNGTVSSYGSSTFTTPAGSASASRSYNRAGTTSVPPSRYNTSQYYRSVPDYASRLYNEGITQNVNGTRYYGSDVPYRNSNQINAPLGYGSLNSFLRNSSQYIHSRGYSSQFAPYYLPSRAAVSSSKAAAAGSVPTNYASQSVVNDYQANQHAGYYYDEFHPDSRSRPLQKDIANMEMQLLRESSQIDPSFIDQAMSIEDSNLRNILLDKYRLQQEKIYKNSQVAQPIDSKITGQQAEDQQEDLIKDRLSDLTAVPLEPGEPEMPGMQAEDVDIDQQETDEQSESEDDSFGLLTPLEPDDQETVEDEPEGNLITGVQLIQQRKDAKLQKETEKEATIDLEIDHETSRAIIGSHGTFENYANAKCSAYIEAADKYLIQGKYYKAADTYALADIYCPDNPKPSWGRGVALFAAGEYLTSADYIEKAISIDNDYATEKIGLSTFIDDEMLDTRLSNLEKWYHTNGSPRFMLLAAYVYYQRGYYENAQQSLDNIAGQMKDHPSYNAMRRAVAAAIGVAGK